MCPGGHAILSGEADIQLDKAKEERLYDTSGSSSMQATQMIEENLSSTSTSKYNAQFNFMTMSYC